MMMWVFGGLVALAVGLVAFLVFAIARARTEGAVRVPGRRGKDKVALGLAVARDTDFSVQVRISHFMYFTMNNLSAAQARQLAGFLESAARDMGTA